MRTRRSLSTLFIPGLSPVKHPRHSWGGDSLPPAPKPGLLLISDDKAAGENLRCAAARLGRSVVQTDRLSEALRQVQTDWPVAVVLDLDLPEEKAWGIAEGLLQEPGCPPLILLTGRREQFDVSTAIRAGSLVDKSGSVEQLLEAVEQTLALPESNRAERNAIQRVVIQWLRPCAWSVPVTPAPRFWGLNE